MTTDCNPRADWLTRKIQLFDAGADFSFLYLDRAIGDGEIVKALFLGGQAAVLQITHDVLNLAGSVIEGRLNELPPAAIQFMASIVLGPAVPILAASAATVNKSSHQIYY